MNPVLSRLAVLVLYLISIPSVHALQSGGSGTIMHAGGGQKFHTGVRLLADVKSVQPGKRFTVGVLMRMDEGWHTYWKNSGDAGLPTQIDWKLPTGFSAGDILWPVPQRFVEGGDIVTYGYKDETMLLVPITVAASVTSRSGVQLQARVRWLECERICIPGETVVQLVLPVDAAQPVPANTALFERYRSSIPRQVDAVSGVTVTSAASEGTVTLTLTPGNGQRLLVRDGVVPDAYPETLENVVVGQSRVVAETGKATISIPLSSYESVRDLRAFQAVVVYQLQRGERTGVAISVPLSNGFAATIPHPGKVEAQPPGPKRLLDEDFIMSSAGDGRQPLYLYILYAIIGGLLLNIMPCVLPVIGLKVFSLIRMSGDRPRQVAKMGWMFSLGILASFLVLALFVILLKTAGEQVGWGFQFQEPVFVVIMSAVIFAFGLSLFGVYEVRLPSAALSRVGGAVEQQEQKGREYLASFGEGILATILATPCTAPILGTALGFAFAQPPAVILLIFASTALGMALPYLLLTWRPAWRRYLPKPGEWMVTAKQVMGFLMMATLLWLLYILGKQLGMEAVIWTGAFLLMVGVACWVIGRFATLSVSRLRYAVTWMAAVLLIVIGYWAFIGPLLEARDVLAAQPEQGLANAGVESAEHGRIPWRVFSVAQLESLLNEKALVFIDFTADWCLTCKVNERTVLADPKVAAKFKSAGVVPLRADWTSSNADITRLLSKFGRSGVPLYVIFPKGRPREPIVLPEVITTGIVLDAIDSAVAASSGSAQR